MPDRKPSIASRTCLALAALMMAAPLGASVRDGVDAWARGDYAAAVAEWQGLADAGDPDAMFNMGQAYRLGRGVPQDLGRAEAFYAAAARAGHVQAADTYGLLLFQDGRREEALPYVQAASGRGDPRAQYLLGVAYFNGDLVERDWERAYALLILANAAELSQAGPAIAQMDEHIPLEQRQAGAALARQLEREATDTRSVELAAADLATQSAPAVSAASSASPVQVAATPRPIQSIAVSPSVSAARDAVAQARQATGTDDPRAAGASFSLDAVSAGQARPAPVQQQQAVTTAPSPPPAAAPSPGAEGPWRVQLGAFGVEGNAERLWSRIVDRPEVAGRERLLLPTGRVTRLQAGGYATRAEAQTACSSLQRAGFDCLVTRN